MHKFVPAVHAVSPQRLVMYDLYKRFL